MSRIVAVSLALLIGGVAHAGEPVTPRYLVNSKAITSAIEKGRDLRELGLNKILDEAELAELRNLAGCRPALQPGMTKNLVVVEWACENGVGTGGQSNIQNRTLKLRFKDEGGLFALAVNPTVSTFAPTSQALIANDLPSKSKTAERFVKAIKIGDDPTLSGLVPLTPLQLHQIGKMTGFEPRIMKPLPEADKRAIRKQFGRAANIYEPPKNGFDVEFEPTRATDIQPLSLTIYFDEKNRPIGVQVEESLLTTIATPPGNR